MFVLPEELEILRDVQPLDALVFYYLAERVDYASGIVGIKRKVSYGGMALDLSERGGKGRSKDKVLTLTSYQVDNSIKRLVGVGLLERLSKSGAHCNLILKRVLWVSVQKMDSSEQSKLARCLLAYASGLNINLLIENNSLEKNKMGTCEVKDVELATTSLQRQRQQGDDAFSMTLDWQPNEKELQMILHRAGGFTLDKIKPEWVSEFVAYWWAEEKRFESQRKWTAMLGAKLVDYLRHPGRFDELRGLSSKPGQAAGASVHHPEFARPPKDNEELVGWMRKHGYGDPEQGHTWQQARAHLQRAIDVRLDKWRKGLS